MENVFKKTIFALIIIFSLNLSFIKADDFYISFQSFVNDIVSVKETKPNISIINFFNDFNKIKNNKCSIKRHDSYVELSPVCFLYPDKNFNLSAEDSLEYLLDDLKWFSNYYSDSDSFFYDSAKPLFESYEFNTYNKYKSSIYEKVVITYMEKFGQKIKLDNKVLSKFVFDNFSFYVVPTYMTNRSHCSLRNYKLAVSKLEWLKLKSWDELNLNSLISYDPLACKWTLWNNYMFFWGSCGASTQLFRLSLLMPNLDVVERHPHSKWWAYYYWNKVSGDDAAMFENSKKFIVKNNFETSIYFKVYEQWEFNYLVWVLPKKTNSYVEINKSISGLSLFVYKKIYIWDTLNDVYQFNSRYNSNYFGKS